MSVKLNESDNPYPFVKITDISTIINILEKRLPKSCYIYNAAKIYPRFMDQVHLAFYTLYGETEQNSFILMTNKREDYGRDYLISAVEEDPRISAEEFSKILSECKLFKWDEPFFFGQVEKFISKTVFDVCVNVKGLCTRVNPCNLYYIEPEECLKLEVSSDDPSVEIKPLDSETGVNFIITNWKYAIKNTDIVMKRLIERNPSAGIYVKGKLICAVVLQGFGLISALNTLEEFRQKGYAKLCMKFLFKEMAKKGLIPCSSVELPNIESYKFHEKLGCKVATLGDYVYSP